MPLTCDMNDDPQRFFEPPRDEDWDAPLATKRARRCSSCNALIRVGEPANRFQRWRRPQREIEERIYVDEVPLAPLWLCSTCAELFSALSDLGFCVDPTEDMFSLLAQYQQLRAELA